MIAKIQRLLPYAVCAVLLLAAGKAAIELAQIAGYIARGAIDGDSLLYIIVGRGMTNGLMPYTDLFESKPPGMFFLSAISLLIFDSAALSTALSVLAYILLPTLPAVYAFVRNRNKPPVMRVIIALSFFLPAVFLTFYFDHRAGALESETFGVFFAILYAWSIIVPVRKRIVGMAVQATLLGLSISMKEPFLAVALLTAFVLCKTKKEFVSVFLIPLCVAAAAGILVMGFLGYLEPYITLQLKSMLQYRATPGTAEVFWLRGFQVYPMLFNIMFGFPRGGLFAFIIVAVLLLFPFFKSSAKHEPSHIAVALCTGFVGLAWMNLLYVSVLKLLYFNILINPSDNPFFTDERMFLPVSLIFAILLAIQYRRRMLAETLISFIPCYMIGLILRTGNHSGGFFAAIVPVFYAALLAMIRDMSVRRHAMLMGAGAVLAAYSAFAFVSDPRQIRYLESRTAYARNEQRMLADKLDNLLDACDIGRYSAADEYQKFAFTRHSPWGPLPAIGNFTFLPVEHELIQRTLNNLQNNNLIFVLSEDGQKNVMSETAEGLSAVMRFYRTVIRENFTTEAPLCAQPFLPMEGYTVWFRKPVEG